jgi:hypothetical protein
MSHFLQAQDRSRLLDEGVTAMQLAVDAVVKQYEEIPIPPSDAPKNPKTE